jgi:hypothetical protein
MPLTQPDPGTPRAYSMKISKYYDQSLAIASRRPLLSAWLGVKRDRAIASIWYDRAEKLGYLRGDLLFVR